MLQPKPTETLPFPIAGRQSYNRIIILTLHPMHIALVKSHTPGIASPKPLQIQINAHKTPVSPDLPLYFSLPHNLWF